MFSDQHSSSSISDVFHVLCRLWPVFYEFDDQKKLESFTMVVEYALRALVSDCR